MFNLFFNIKIRSKKYFLVDKCHVVANHQKQIGQIGIIVILIMMVMLTVGLSIASRSAREVDISSEGEKAARAFNTTESGVEQALSQIYQYEKIGVTLNSSSESEQLKYNISELDSLETKIYQGYSAKLPLNSADDSLTIEWSKIACDNDPLPAALLVSIFSTNDDDLVVSRHYAIDACDIRSIANNFINADDIGDDYQFKYTILGLNGGNQTPLFARVTPIYNDAEIKVAGLADTTQYGILARGRGNDNSLETKAIIVDRTIPSAPSFMNFGIVSGGSITK